MAEADQKTDRNYLAWMKSIAILLFGLIAGAALIYLAQSPKPVPGSLLYEIHIFTSDERVEDFTPHFQMLQNNAAQGVRLISGGDMVGNIQFSSEPGILTRFSLELPKALGQYQTFTPIQFDIRGDSVRDRVRLNLKINIDSAEASHQLELGDGQYRVIEVLPGEKGRQKWCYAIIQVHSVQGMPVAALANPQPPPVPIKRPAK